MNESIRISAANASLATQAALDAMNDLREHIERDDKGEDPGVDGAHRYARAEVFAATKTIESARCALARASHALGLNE